MAGRSEPGAGQKSVSVDPERLRALGGDPHDKGKDGLISKSRVDKCKNFCNATAGLEIV